MHWFHSHLIYLSLTKPRMQQCFHPSAKHLLTSTSHLVLLDILFVLKVKLITFLRIHRCAFGFNLKYIFASLRKNSYNETFDFTWCRVISRTGLGLRFVKIFRVCVQNFCITLGVA